eukprot:7104486-Ditylum_brightwellii.AAC.1
MDCHKNNIPFTLHSQDTLNPITTIYLQNDLETYRGEESSKTSNMKKQKAGLEEKKISSINDIIVTEFGT